MMQKITPKILLPFLTILFFQFQIQAQTGCPGCQIDLPSGLSADTIYLDDFPDAMVNQPYDEDLSFRLPMTTTPVAANDPTIFPNIPLDEIKITGIGNLPAGLSYEPNQEVYDLPNETDGCAKICGTPLIPGTYVVEIFLEVKISFLTQNTSFEKVIVVNGGTSNNDGFSINQNIGCGAMTVEFINNIVSNGQDGFSYFWDFGNGNTSIDENPTPQTYDTPGSYEVSYQSVIDTVGYFLTNITVTESDCNDILSALDLYLVLQDPNGVVISTANVGNTNPPVQFPLNYEIGAGNYTLTVMDEDGGIDGGDDICGIFTINQLTGNTMSSGGADIELTIIHPVDTVQTTDSIFVYPVPDAPTITAMVNEMNCEGDTLVLIASETTDIQWYIDGNEIPGETNEQFEATESGMYTVVFTNEFGCTATSIEEEVIFYENPPEPEFVDDNTSLLSLDASITVVPNYAFQWYFENTLLQDETNPTLCIDNSGLYTLTITDLSTGCVSSFTSTGTYNPDYLCGAVSIENLIGNSLNIYPNPFNEFLVVELELNEIAELQINLTDILGRKIALKSANHLFGNFRESFDLSALSSGVYFLEITIDDEKLVKKVIKP